MAGIRSCKDCTERYMGCHSYCQKYLSEKAEYDERKLREKKIKDVTWGVVNSNYHRMNTRNRKSRSIV